MFRFEFIDDTNDIHARRVLIEVPGNDHTLDNVLNFMADFLRGVGYVIDGHLEVVEDEPYVRVEACSGKCCGNKPDNGEDNE